jgi:predicted nucleic acid-binding protein
VNDKNALSRLFADVNVLIAGADSRSGASRALLLMAEVGLFQLVVSRQVLAEAERNIRRKLPRSLGNFAEQMSYLNLEIVPDPPAEAIARWLEAIEAKDAPILAAAVLASVDRFITLNTRDFTAEVSRHSGLLIQTPAALIEELRLLVGRGLAEANE